MAKALGRAVDYLKDPFLVRRIQEYFGVQQITLTEEGSCARGTDPAESSSGISSSDGDGDNPGAGGSGDEGSLKKKRHRRLSSRDSNINSDSNGAVPSTNTIEWLKSNIKVRKRFKSSPSPVHSRTASPEPEQQQPASPIEVIVESYPLLDIYFRLAAELGYEPFYVTFLPMMAWNVDTLVARHVVILWCISMYVGQACKQLFKLRRPNSPPALRIEQNPDLETEYGFPSTHAIVSTTIPFYYLYSCFGRYEVQSKVGCTCTCVVGTEELFRMYVCVCV